MANSHANEHDLGLLRNHITGYTLLAATNDIRVDTTWSVESDPLSALETR